MAAAMSASPLMTVPGQRSDPLGERLASDRLEATLHLLLRCCMLLRFLCLPSSDEMLVIRVDSLDLGRMLGVAGAVRLREAACRVYAGCVRQTAVWTGPLLSLMLSGNEPRGLLVTVLLSALRRKDDRGVELVEENVKSWVTTCGRVSWRPEFKRTLAGCYGCERRASCACACSCACTDVSSMDEER